MKLSSQSLKIIDQIADNVGDFSSSNLSAAYGGSYATAPTAQALEAITGLKNAVAKNATKKQMHATLDELEAAIQSMATLSVSAPILQAQTNPSMVSPDEINPVLTAIDSIRDELETGVAPKEMPEASFENFKAPETQKRSSRPVYLFLVFAIAIGFLMQVVIILTRVF